MPSALAVGVSYDIFWHLNPKKLHPFFESHKIRRQERSNDMWLMGQYVAAALDATVCNAMPFVKRRRKGKYPERPIQVLPKTEKEKQFEEEQALQQALAAFGILEKDIKRKMKGE